MLNLIFSLGSALELLCIVMQQILKFKKAFFRLRKEPDGCYFLIFEVNKPATEKLSEMFYMLFLKCYSAYDLLKGRVSFLVPVCVAA